MAVTLAQAKLNTQDDLDMLVIDEFRKSSAILNALTFHDTVNPASTAGSTLTYGYHRVTTQRAADYRTINFEYTPAVSSTTRYTVDLAVLGGSFQIDRVLDAIARSAETSFQVSQLIKATGAFFNDQVINGDNSVDLDGFDGLNVALTGSSTEYLPLDYGVTVGYLDLSVATAYDTDAEVHAILDHVDAFLSLLDAVPDMLLMPRQLKLKLISLARRAGFWTRERDEFGRQVDAYNGIPMIDPGEKSGATTQVIALATRDADAGGAGGNITNLADLYAVRYGLDGFHAVSTSGQPLVQTWEPDFSTAGAVKTGEVELGPVAVALKASKAAGVLRNFKVAV